MAINELVGSMSGKNVFVFVVCGADEHIETLNFSLKYLRHFSKSEIIVVTDRKRNSLEIDHDFIIDIETPDHYDHHQASIWLKTGLYLFLPPENNYCYLDTDVIALNHEVDDIFNYFEAPITFAPDHCKLNLFSAAAVNCPCSGIFNERKKRFSDILNTIIPGYDFEKEFQSIYRRIIARKIKTAFNSPVSNSFFITKLLFRRYLPDFIRLRINDEIIYSKKDKAWLDSKGNKVAHVIMDYYPVIKRKSNFRYSRFHSKWYDAQGDVFDSKGCEHLQELILKKFNIKVTDNEWQHWNGGVFLFNKSSVDFLETWHQHTVDIFADKGWKTRDQGTLITTVWELGLEKHKTLPEEFNFIVDFHNPNITFDEKKGFTKDNFMTIIRPNFVHVYHEFGNKDWDIWRGIEKH